MQRAWNGKEEKLIQILVGNPEGRWPLGKPGRSWEYGIKMDLKQI
jgi:hypothetical protein